MVAHRKGRQHQGGIAARPGATALCASTGSAQVDEADSAPLPPARPVPADSPLTGALGSPFPFVYREKRLVRAQLGFAKGKRVIGYRGERTSLARSIMSEKCQETTWLLYERLGT